MKPQGKRARLAGVLATLALGAIALLALPAIGVGQDGDGKKGPRAAGTIESFDRESGELTVALAQGGTISAKVIRRTRVRCGVAGQRRRARLGMRADASNRSGEARRRAAGNGLARRGRCTRADLVEGATVMRAQIILTHGMAVYKSIGLLPDQATETGPGEEDQEETEDSGEDGPGDE